MELVEGVDEEVGGQINGICYNRIMKIVDALYPYSQEWISYREPALKLINLLSKNGLTLSVIDGCGGHVLNQLTIPGATRAFRMGVVANNWEAKIQLGTPVQLMDTYGEFSLETAKYLSQLALGLHNDTVGLAVAGEYIAITKKGVQPWGTRILLPQNSYDAHTTQFIRSQFSLSFAHMYLSGKKLHENGKHLLASMRLSETIPDNNLSQTINKISDILHFSGQKIATMESCTGGALACAFDSSLIDSAWVTYDEDAKISLGVPVTTMSYGMVYSERVALAMAQAIQQKTGVAIALASTGCLDTPDTRPYHTDALPGTIYTAITIKGRDPLIKKLILPIGLREHMKLVVVEDMMNDLLFALSQKKEEKDLFISPIEQFIIQNVIEVKSIQSQD